VPEIDVDDLLRSTGAILEGHFKLASGRHSGTYIEKFRIMENPPATEVLCGMIADHFRHLKPSVVVGPATGGIILAYETARQLGVPNIFAEKDDKDGMYFDRGFSVAPGQAVLVVDDVLTTGGSVKKVLKLLDEAGADIKGVGFLIDRTNGGVDFGVPFFACHPMAIASYSEGSCPICTQGLLLVET
jgi:orotate phosphoribosyltransferase